MQNTPLAPPTLEEDNDAAFEGEHEQRLLETNHGEIALMHDGMFEGAFANSVDAATAGYDRFGQGNFSLHLIGTRTYDIAPVISTTPL